MDAEMLKFFATLGVGGVLAGLMLWVNQRDAKRYADSLQEFKKQAEADRAELLDVVRETTVAVTNNTAVSHAMVKLVKRLAPQDLVRD